MSTSGTSKGIVNLDEDALGKKQNNIKNKNNNCFNSLSYTTPPRATSRTNESSANYSFIGEFTSILTDPSLLKESQSSPQAGEEETSHLDHLSSNSESDNSVGGNTPPTAEPNTEERSSVEKEQSTPPTILSDTDGANNKVKLGETLSTIEHTADEEDLISEANKVEFVNTNRNPPKRPIKSLEDYVKHKMTLSNLNGAMSAYDYALNLVVLLCAFLEWSFYGGLETRIISTRVIPLMKLYFYGYIFGLTYYMRNQSVYDADAGNKTEYHWYLIAGYNKPLPKRRYILYILLSICSVKLGYEIAFRINYEKILNNGVWSSMMQLLVLIVLNFFLNLIMDQIISPETSGYGSEYYSRVDMVELEKKMKNERCHFTPTFKSR